MSKVDGEQCEMFATLVTEEVEELEVDTTQLKQLAELAYLQLSLEREIADLEGQLKQKKQRWAQVAEKDIPALMRDEIGMESFKLIDGTTITTKEKLFASISAKNKPLARQWLIANDHGALVKETVQAQFEKGEHEKVTAAVSLLAENGYEVTTSETINTASVKSMITELIDQGMDVPLDIFGAFFKNVTTIKRQ